MIKFISSVDGAFLWQTTNVNQPIPADAVKVSEGVYQIPPPPAPDPEPAPVVTLVSPVEFKMLFKSSERIAISQARKDESEENAETKAVLDDWFGIVDDPRLSVVDLTLQSTIDGVNFLVSAGIITSERATQILAGEIQ